MTERIPQHRHCSKCGKAHLEDDRFCSEECRAYTNDNLKKKKRQLLVLYAVTLGVLVVALLFLR